MTDCDNCDNCETCETCNQTGGDGYAMNMEQHIAGQPVVEGYNCCDNAAVNPQVAADATNQVGGGINPFNFIINPTTGARMSLFSSGGKALLKNLINLYKNGGSSVDTSDTPVDEADADDDADDVEEEEEVVLGHGEKTIVKCQEVEEEEENGGVVVEGGAPAELPGAFGEDYFNTEADALKGEW